MIRSVIERLLLRTLRAAVGRHHAVVVIATDLPIQELKRALHIAVRDVRRQS